MGTGWWGDRPGRCDAWLAGRAGFSSARLACVHPTDDLAGVCASQCCTLAMSCCLCQACLTGMVFTCSWSAALLRSRMPSSVSSIRLMNFFVSMPSELS